MPFRILLAAVAIISIGSSATSIAHADQGSEAPLYKLDFENVELRTAIESVASMVHKTIIVDPRIDTSELVTLKSDLAISGSEAYRQLKLLLAMHGMSTIENRNIVKVVLSDFMPLVRT